MNSLGNVKFFRGRVKIERSEVRPKPHNAESVEKRHFLLQRNPTHVLGISAQGDHRFGSRAVLRVYQNHVRAGATGNVMPASSAWLNWSGSTARIASRSEERRV